MSASVDFQSQIASIMEVLANAAVAEICKVVDDGYAVVHLEMSRSHKDNEFLRRKIKLLELQVARFRAEKMKFSEGSPNNSRFGVRLLNRHTRDMQSPGGPSSLQNKVRLANRSSASGNKAVTSRDRSPIKVELNPASNQDSLTPKNESTEDMDLLIVKVEGADAATSGSLERPLEGDSEHSQPTATTKEKDASKPSQPPINTSGCNVTEDQSAAGGEEEDGKPVEGQNTEGQQDTVVQQDRVQQDRVQDNIQGYSKVKSDIIIIDPFPAEVDGHDDSGPSSSWAPDMGATQHWRESDGGSADDSTALHLGTQGSAYHHLPPVVQVTGRPSAVDERLYNMNGTLDFNHFQNNLAAPVCMTTGGQQQHPQWAGFSQSGNASISQPGNVSGGPGSNLDQVGAEARPYRCAFCLRQYTHLCQLRIHERVHTGEKPYQCAQCGKQFGQFCSLKRHQRVHTGEKPYRCAQCGKQFSHSNNLKVHQSVHTGERKFHCTQCGKNFSFLSNLIRHQAVHAAGK